MNNKLSTLLTTAIVTGFLAGQVAKAEDAAAQNSGDKVTAEKNTCKGEKNSCKGHTDSKKKKKSDKNSCKNGCGEAKDKESTKKEESK